MSACFNDKISPFLAENAIQIALNYLERSGEIVDYTETCEFLIGKIGFMIRRGELNKLVLANRAITAYQRHRTARTTERSPVSE